MMNSRILLLAACCALMPSAWAGAGLTSAGVDPQPVNNNAQDEPTLAQVAPVANQTGIVSSGPNAAVPNPAVAGTAGAAGANGPQAANAAADGSKAGAAPVAVVPAPPPPPPDPSTLPVSVIRPLNKSAETVAPKAEAESAVTTTAPRPGRHAASEAPVEPMPAQGRAPTAAAPARAPQPAPTARAEPPRTAVNATPATTPPTSATADGSANGFVFYTGMGIAGIILALSFVGYMRAGTDTGRPRA